MGTIGVDLDQLNSQELNDERKICQQKALQGLSADQRKQVGASGTGKQDETGFRTCCLVRLLLAWEPETELNLLHFLQPVMLLGVITGIVMTAVGILFKPSISLFWACNVAYGLMQVPLFVIGAFVINIPSREKLQNELKVPAPSLPASIRTHTHHFLCALGAKPSSH